ncbi:DUF3226 domain-containing protein [Arachidicoccus sp.]|uniref:DUF3226 domain-containing protein n=1 Tax=Arachidicoccus sp. TaxID=1872624 RepID=UPI003D20B7BE
MSGREKFNSKLLVEGKDDQHVIWALCAKFNLAQNFDVIDCEGITNLLEQIPVRFKQSGINTIGIIVDADSNLQSRWNSLKDLLKAQGFNLPHDLPAEGLIEKNADNKRIGVWIMPNNNLNGMLEDFISFLIPQNDNLLPVVKATLQDIEDKNLNKYRGTHKSKAVIHTWLAWQEVPGTPIGSSITKSYLTTNVESCFQLINWLKLLFFDDGR